MVRVFVGLIWLSALLISFSCATTHKIESGVYILAVKQQKSSKNMPKKVEIRVQDDKIEIQNPEHNQVLKGKISGNTVTLTGQVNSQTVEFIGKLVANNRVTGKVVQKKDTATVREAEFTIEKSTDQ